MTNDLVPTNEGYSIQTDNKKLFFANAELVNVGCLNCIWRMHGQCPHKLGEDDLYNPSEVVDVTLKEQIICPKNKDKVCEEDLNGLCYYCYRDMAKDTDVKISNPSESVPICPEMIQFLVSLAEKDDSITAVWEKFLIYKLRIQESVDYKDYMRLENKIKESRENKDKTPEEMENLKMDKTAAKLWWSKLNQQAINSAQKIVDREAKRDVGKKGAGIFTKSINFNIKQVEKK